MDETSEASSVGVELGGTKGILIAGKHFERFDTGGSFSPDALVSKLMDFISRLDLPLRKVGIAVPGRVDSSGRVVACDVLPAFEGGSQKDSSGSIAPVHGVKKLPLTRPPH